MSSMMCGMLLGAGVSAKKIYVDDVFSTYVYKGNESARAINNGIDLSGEGGLVWVKSRNDTHDHHLVDTVRGANDILDSSSYGGEATIANRITGFNSNGFNLGSAGQVNGTSSYDYASWTFRKAPGFFDIVTYDGNGTAGRQISHNLGCKPGLILVKRYLMGGASAANWAIYHRDITADKWLKLNSTDQAYNTSTIWNNTEPTSTHFTVGTENEVNASSSSEDARYVAYLFAGGESTAATARSIDLDGNEGLDIAASSSMNLGTGQFCIEGWFKMDEAPGSGSPSYARLFMLDGPTGNNSTNLQLTINPSNSALQVQDGGDTVCESTNFNKGKWVHFALTRYSNTLTLYLDGTKADTGDTTQNFNPNSGSPRVRIGHYDTSSNGVFNGKISNIRITTNDSVYSSDFRPPTEPLTTTSQGVSSSNVKLLCCNGSSTTSSTVTPGTISAVGSPTASTDSPFDDPAGFKFGDSKEGIIKCGSYTGNGSNSAPPEIYLGWEPQWVMVKRINGSGQDWVMVDSMRGMFSGLSQTPHLRANETNSEQDTSYYRIDVSSGTGFAPFTSDNGLNGDGDEYIYIALRRPDGYVGKPAESGTDVFTMDTGAGGSTVPGFDSGFPVDFALARQPASADNWYTYSRLTGTKRLKTDTANGDENDSSNEMDSNVGWYTAIGNSYQSWMWKRHAGFDVVTYTGNSTNPRTVFHSLSKEPEMIWLKRKNTTDNWLVGANFGSSNYDILKVNLTDAAINLDYDARFMSKPTSTAFTIDADSSVNGNGSTYLAMLFASVDGISKVGSYTGNGSSAGPSITTGFSPRFILLRNITDSENWIVLDTLRDLSSSADEDVIYLNSSDEQYTQGCMNISSTGFSLADGNNRFNGNGDTFIYYAHA